MSVEREPALSLQSVRVRVWDAPVRVFHWLLAVLIAFSWWSAEEGRLEWHRWAGYTVLTLVLFRICWGFWGSQTARFSHFVRGGGALGAYATTLFAPSTGRRVGHNPIGGWSVLAMITLLLVQTALGLVSVDVDGIESGPLAGWVSFDQGRLAAEAHHFVFNMLLVLIALHVAAIAFYAIVKRDNLIGPMITGAKTIISDAASEPSRAPVWRALVLLALAAGLVYAVSNGFWLR